MGGGSSWVGRRNLLGWEGGSEVELWGWEEEVLGLGGGSFWVVRGRL